MAARQQNANGGGGGSRDRTHARAETTGRGGSDGGSGSGGHSNRSGVTALGCAAVVFDQLRANGKLLAVHKADFRQFDAQPGSALRAARFLRFGDASGDRLSAARHYEAVDYQRLNESAGEDVARLVVITRNRLVDPYFQPGSGGHDEMQGRGRIILAGRRGGFLVRQGRVGGRRGSITGWHGLAKLPPTCSRGGRRWIRLLRVDRNQRG
ncbi:MAG: hypothetical protein IANPNBLG_03216 [Bryobacteraceae bacterium]|nr:hypothetical protein [Bryobacteraceae bacterium]